MDNNNKNTEQDIFNAAVKIFTVNGFNGTSMQMIANESATNKALLHYYYRSKQQLFEKVFLKIGQDFLKILVSVFEKEVSLTEKINTLIRSLIFYGQTKPDYIYFLISEIKRDNTLIPKFNGLLNVQFKKCIFSFYRQINEAVETRQIKQIHPRELLEIIFTVCFSDVVNKPFFEGLLGKGIENLSQTENEITRKTEQVLKMIS